MRRKIIAVIGDATIDEGGDKFNLCVELGMALVDAGYRVQTGGRGGVMQAVMLGAKKSKKYREGDTIAISPFFGRAEANPYADIIISTGMDFHRNNIVVNTDAVIAIGGGAGTLAEIANAWHLMKLIIGYKNVDGWSGRIAGNPVDHRKRYPDIADDRVYAVSCAEEAIATLKEKIDRYSIQYRGIRESL